MEYRIKNYPFSPTVKMFYEEGNAFNMFVKDDVKDASILVGNAEYEQNIVNKKTPQGTSVTTVQKDFRIL